MLTDKLREMIQEEVEPTLDAEIGALRVALGIARCSLESAEQGNGDPGDVAKMGVLVARLSDSIGRALLAQKKLSSSNDQVAHIRAELDHVLRVIER
jgi:hypothetical protein